MAGWRASEVDVGNLIAARLDDLEGFGGVALFEGEQGRRGGVHPQDVGPPLLQVIPVFLARRVAAHEVEKPQVAGGISQRVGPALELEQPEIPEVVERALAEKLRASLRPQLELAPGGPGLRQPLQMKLQRRLQPVRPGAVRAALHFELFESERRADLENLAPVLAADDARIVLRIKRPVIQQLADIPCIAHAPPLSPSGGNVQQSGAANVGLSA